MMRLICLFAGHVWRWDVDGACCLRCRVRDEGLIP